MKNIKSEGFIFFVLVFFICIIFGCIYESLHEYPYKKALNCLHESEKFREFNKIRLLTEYKDTLQIKEEKFTLHDYVNNDRYNNVNTNNYTLYKDKEEQFNDTICVVDKKKENGTINNEEECNKNFYQYLQYLEHNVHGKENNNKYDNKYDNQNDNKYDSKYDNQNDNKYDSKYDNQYDNKYDNQNDNKYDNQNDNQYDNKYDETNYFLWGNDKHIDSEHNGINKIYKETIHKALTSDVSTENSNTHNNSRDGEPQNGKLTYNNQSNNNLTYDNSSYNITPYHGPNNNIPYNKSNNSEQCNTQDNKHCNALDIYHTSYGPDNYPHGYDNHTHGYDNHPHGYDNHTHGYDNHPHGYDNHPHGYDKHPHGPDNHPHGYDNHPHGYDNHPHGYDNYPHRPHIYPHGYDNHPHRPHIYPHGYDNHPHRPHIYPHNFPMRNESVGGPYYRPPHLIERSDYYSNPKNEPHNMMLPYNTMEDNTSICDEQSFQLELEKIIKKNNLQNGNIRDSHDTGINDYDKRLTEYNKRLTEYNKRLNEYTKRLNEHYKRSGYNIQNRQNSIEHIPSNDIVLYGHNFQNAFRYKQNTRSYYPHVNSKGTAQHQKSMYFTQQNNYSQEYPTKSEQHMYHVKSKRLEKKLYDYQNGTNPITNFLERHF
ncbi:Plasmodium exported protein (hyp1), unknown function [Plasmodium reichenowi]|uniref:Uncharacterized protein n=1 Tax=Plasmodium reichenowi TaxID=5854 RepID=A0A060RN16_PLARE|nr:Plasmodium exported protein (hyp1), unknown function [Plasmodium reichenowi]